METKCKKMDSQVLHIVLKGRYLAEVLQMVGLFK